MDENEVQGTEEGQQQGMTRRRFLGAAAVAGAAAGFMGAGPIASAFASEGDAAQEIAWDYETDVLVLGTGPAGVACAANAARAGAAVMVLEMNDKIGGKGILAGGNLGIGGGTRMQKLNPAWIENADIIYEDRVVEALRTDGQMMTVGDVEGGSHKIGQWRKISGCADADGLARVFADRSLDTWNWLDELKCPFIKANISAYANVYRGSRYYTTTTAKPVDRANPTGMNAGGAGLIWPMYDDAKSHGAEFFLSHKMTRIIREGDRAGRVLGVEAQNGDKILYFKARKAVFLGTGSWNGSKNLKQLFLPWLSKYPHVSGEPYVFNDGSGMEAALEAGASLTTDRGSDWHGWHRHPGTRWHSITQPYGMPGTAEPLDSECIYVNAEGKRFMNEEIGEDNPAWVGGNPPFYFAQLCATQTTDVDGPIVWIILDETSRAKQNLVFTPGTTVEAPMYKTAASIAELAPLIGVPAANLTAAVTKYNGFVTAGKDDDFGKAVLAAQIAVGPFHAVKWGIQKHNTLGGVTVNEKAQVKDWTSNVIPGLYAAGESAGGMDLIGLSKPILFGRVAGEWAAKETSPGAEPTAVAFKAGNASLMHGKSVQLNAHLSGQHGYPAGASVVFEVRRPGEGKFVKISSKKVADGAAAIKYRLAKKGTYYFRARFMATADFAASASKAAKVVSK